MHRSPRVSPEPSAAPRFPEDSAAGSEAATGDHHPRDNMTSFASYSPRAPEPVPAYRTGAYQQPSPASKALAALVFTPEPGPKAEAHPEVAPLVARGGKGLYFDAEGTTPLHKAAAANAAASVKLLLDAYAGEETTAGEKTSVAAALAARTAATQETPLLAACGAGAVDVVSLLLSAYHTADDDGLGEQPCNAYGNTAFHLAARAPANAVATLQLLLTANPEAGGSALSSPNTRGAHPLHFALFAKPEAEAVAAVQLLASLGGGGGVGAVDLNARDAEGQTPLHAAAAAHRSPALVEALLRAGADPSVRDEHGRTAADLVEDLFSTNAGVGNAGAVDKEQRTTTTRLLTLLRPGDGAAEAKEEEKARGGGGGGVPKPTKKAAGAAGTAKPGAAKTGAAKTGAAARGGVARGGGGGGKAAAATSGSIGGGSGRQRKGVPLPPPAAAARNKAAAAAAPARAPARAAARTTKSATTATPQKKAAAPEYL